MAKRNLTVVLADQDDGTFAYFIVDGKEICVGGMNPAFMAIDPDFRAAWEKILSESAERFIKKNGGRITSTSCGFNTGVDKVQ